MHSCNVGLLHLKKLIIINCGSSCSPVCPVIFYCLVIMVSVKPCQIPQTNCISMVCFDLSLVYMPALFWVTFAIRGLPRPKISPINLTYHNLNIILDTFSLFCY